MEDLWGTEIFSGMETFWTIVVAVIEVLILLYIVYRKLEYKGLKSAFIAAAVYALVVIIISDLYWAWYINDLLGEFGKELFSSMFTVKVFAKQWIIRTALYEIYTAICCGIAAKTDSSTICIILSLVICLIIHYISLY